MSSWEKVMRSKQSRWRVDEIMGTLGETSVCGPQHRPGCVLPLSLCPCCASAWTTLSSSSPDLCSLLLLQCLLKRPAPMGRAWPSHALHHLVSLSCSNFFLNTCHFLTYYILMGSYACFLSQHVTCRECVSFAHGCNPGP